MDNDVCPQSLPAIMASQTLPPGNLGLSLLGETIAFLRDPNFAKKRHQQYGSVFKTQLLGSPTVFLKGAEANYFVLVNENKYFEVSWPPSVSKLLGLLSLAMQTGELHIKRRKFLAQAFQPRALAGYLPTMESISQQYFQRWTVLETFEWYPELRNYTFDVACKLLMGLEHASATELGHWFETWAKGLFTIPVNLPWTRFGKACRSRQLLLSGLEALIRERQQQPEPGNDALGVLLQATDDEGNQLSLEELKDQVLTLLFAGHETLTSALASFCLLMAQNPEAKARVRVEQARFVDVPLTLEALKEMTFLEQVLNRLRTSGS